MTTQQTTPTTSQTTQPGATPIRVFLVDDQPAVRQGLRLRLSAETDLEVVGEAGDGTDAIAQAADSRPDVVVLDIAMPGLDGFATAQGLHAVVPGAAIVMLSLHDDAASRARAFAAGAAVFVGKHEADHLLVDAIRRVAAHSEDGGP